MRLALLLALPFALFACSCDISAEDAPTKSEAAPKFDSEAAVDLFNGKDLTGWEGETELWSATDGMIVGDSPGIKYNSFLATTKTYADFDMTFDFRMTAKNGNSGVQFRSKRVPDSTHVTGYQADMGQKYWGCLYDEHRRNKVLAAAPEALAKVLKPAGWNTYRIRAEGPRVRLWINDLKTVDYTEPNDEIARDGIIALQLHSGGPLKMEFKNLKLVDLSSSN